jgi:hypothetical protein
MHTNTVQPVNGHDKWKYIDIDPNAGKTHLNAGGQFVQVTGKRTSIFL